MSIGKILVLTDFSPCSDRALGLALEMARGMGAHLEVVHCFAEVPGGRAPVGSAGLDPALRENALARMKEQVDRFDAEGVSLELDAHPGLYAATAILDAARKATPDLIVVGTHGRTGLKHALLGSVAEQVVHEAPCPVVVVKAS